MLQFISNPNLETILSPTDWKGTPVSKEGRFVNHEHPFSTALADVLKWQLTANPDKDLKKHDKWRLQPVAYNDWLTSNIDCIVWLGHSSFFIRLDGKTILIDPVFGDLSFFMKRFVKFPLDPSKLKNLDYILLSHDHRDHLDEPSIKALAKNNPNAHFFTGLGIEGLLQSFTGSKLIQSAGWFQKYQTPNSPLEIFYLPSRHWGRRFLTDTNVRLWGAFVIRSSTKTIYFSGDTGYGSHFKKAAELFPDITHAIIGIGAYKPEWFMGANHISPQDAVKGFNELGAKHLLPMHYGTFDLSDESLSDPYQSMIKQREMGNINGVLILPQPGEVVEV
ncbi:MBL fold metallo-hydrolase [soil metagenome]